MAKDKEGNKPSPRGPMLPRTMLEKVQFFLRLYNAKAIVSLRAKKDHFHITWMD